MSVIFDNDMCTNQSSRLRLWPFLRLTLRHRRLEAIVETAAGSSLRRRHHLASAPLPLLHVHVVLLHARCAGRLPARVDGHGRSTHAAALASHVVLLPLLRPLSQPLHLRTRHLRRRGSAALQHKSFPVRRVQRVHGRARLELKIGHGPHAAARHTRAIAIPKWRIELCCRSYCRC